VKPKAQTSALYTYAIGRQQGLRKLFDAGTVPAGVAPGVPVALVTEGKLAAVVSEVSLSDFGTGRFEKNLQDPAWAAERVMRHEQVAEFLARHEPVVPLRFGVLYTSPEPIRQMLSRRRDQLEGVLDRITDREEWGLNILSDAKTLQERLVQLSPRLAELQSRAAQSTPGQAYLLEKKLESLRSIEGKSETRRMVKEIREEVETHTDGIKDISIREVESKQHPAMVGKWSCLVSRKARKRFHSMARKLAKKYAPYGLKFELTGPWPPYNFSE
jgi:gas vesicle protein GvpL/GvpF